MNGHDAVDAALASKAFGILEAPQEAAASGAAATAAIDALGAVLSATPDGPLRAVILSNLGVLHLARFEYEAALSDLDSAVAALFEAYREQERHGSHPALSAIIPNLIDARLTRAEHTGNWADLDAAISWGRGAIVRLPPGLPQRAAGLAALSSALLARHERAGAKEASDGDITEDGDLLEAVDLGRQAVADLPRDHPRMGPVLSALGKALFLCGMADESIGVYRRALERFRATGDPSGEARAANNLGGALLPAGRFEEAVTAFQQALAGFREIGDAQGEARVSNNLAVTLARIGRRGDALPLLQRALDIAEATLGPDHPDTALRRRNLAAMQRAATGEEADDGTDRGRAPEAERRR